MTRSLQKQHNTPHIEQQKLGPEASTDEFSSSFAALQTDQTNLVLRALDLFRRKTGKQDHFKVYLEKRTPVQAGLGGGSSNAATTLFAANQVGGWMGGWVDDWRLWWCVRLIEWAAAGLIHLYTRTSNTIRRCWAAPLRTPT
jgi:hypothetical protein